MLSGIPGLVILNNVIEKQINIKIVYLFIRKSMKYTDAVLSGVALMYSKIKIAKS